MIIFISAMPDPLYFLIWLPNIFVHKNIKLIILRKNFLFLLNNGILLIIYNYIDMNKNFIIDYMIEIFVVSTLFFYIIVYVFLIQINNYITHFEYKFIKRNN